MKKHPLVLACVTAAALVACGGGGGGGSSGPTSITADNASLVSAVAYRAASAMFDVATVGAEGVAAVGSAPARASEAPGVVPFAASMVAYLRTHGNSSSRAMPQRAAQETFDCEGGGTMTVRVDDADNDGTLSTGDKARVTFSGCQDSGLMLNGAFALSNLQVDSDTSYRATATFDGLRIDDGTRVTGADGAVTIAVSEPVGAPATYQASGTSLRVVSGQDVHKLSDFAGTATVDATARQVSYTFAGRVSDSSNNVSVQAATLEPFRGSMDSDYPSSGQLQSTGAANSRALLTALSATEVSVAVDANGDGSVESTSTMTWQAFDSVPD
jgi:hypothetical protein